MLSRIYITFLLIAMSACGKVGLETNLTGANSLSGIIKPLVGLIADNKNKRELISSAYAVPCTDPVYASLYALDVNGQQEATAVATYQVKSDARYIFDAKALGINLDSKVQYIVEVTGCDYLFSRPVTAINLEQNINYGTTFISFATNANLSKNLREVPRAQLEAFMKELEGNSFNNVSTTINSSPDLTNKFQTMFGSNLSDLEKASPKIVYYNIPSLINEKTLSAYQVNTIHLDPAYDTVYKWKLDGALKSSSPLWNYTPGGNDQGTHFISLYIGKNDGAGNVDLTVPYLIRNFMITVMNSAPPIVPDISTANAIVVSPNITIDLDTGFAQVNCDTFEKLAVTENLATAPTDPALYDVTCSQAVSQSIPFTISSDGPKTIRVWAMDSAGTISLNPKSVNVILNTGIPSTLQSQITVSDASISAGGTSTVTLSVKNSAGGDIASATGLAVTFSRSGGVSNGSFSAVTDNNDGTYTATFTGSASGTATTINATLDGVAITSTLPTIAVTPGAFSLSQSTLSASASSVASGSSVTATITPKDAYGNLNPTGITAITVGSSTTAGTGSLTAVSSNGNGTYSSTFSGINPGAVGLKAYINGSIFTSTLPTVTVNNGVPSLSLSTITLSSNTMTSGSGISVTLTARNAAGTQIPSGGLTVAFSRSGGVSTGTFSSVTDNGDGTYSATFTGVLAGSATTINATIGGSALTSTSPTASVTPGAFSLAQSILSSSAGSVASGSSVTATLTPKDANGNINPTGITAVTMSASNTGGSGSLSAVTANGNGTYTATFSGINLGSVTLSSSINGSAITSTLPTVVVTTGIASTSLSTYSLSSGSVVSGSTVTVTLTARNAAGVQIPSGGLTVAFSRSGGTSTGNFSVVTDNGNGTYTATLTGIVAGSATTINATINGTAVSSTAPTLGVTPGAFTLAQSILTRSAATAASGTTVLVTLTPKDANGNLNPTGITAVTMGATNNAGSGTLSSVTANASTYTATFSAINTGLVTFSSSINGSAITSTLPSITVTAGVPSVSLSTVSVSDSSVASDSTLTVTFTAINSAGVQIPIGGATVSFFLLGESTADFSATTDNGDGTYTATLTGNVAGNPSEVKALVNGLLLSSTSPNVEVTPGPFNLAASTMEVDVNSILSGDILTATLTPMDANGNTFPTGITAVTMTSSNIGGTGTFSAVTVQPDGTYTSTFTGVLAGSVTLTSNINGSPVTGSQPVVTVSPGAASIATSLVTISSATVASGSTVTATLQAKDAAGNSITTGGLTVLLFNSGGASTGTWAATTDVGNGTYTRVLTTTTSGNATTINASIGGVTVTRTPKPTLIVTPGVASAAQSPITLSSATVNSGSAITITLTTKDASMNTLTTGGRTVVFSAVTGAGISTGTISGTTDVGNGTYTATFTGGVKGTAATINATIDGALVTKTPIPSVTVNPGPIATNKSTITVASNTVGAAESIVVTLHAKDAAGNIITTGGSTVLFSHSGGTSTGTFSATTDLGNGLYTSNFTGVVAGTATTMNATIGGVAVTSTPLPTVLVGIGSVSVATSTVALSSGTVVSGNSITVTLTAKDSSGNLIPSGGLDVDFDINGGTSTGTFSAVTDNNDGTYTATITGVVSGTATNVRAFINGTQVTNSTPAMTVSVGPLSYAGSTITVTAPIVASNTAVTLTVTTRDAAGNIVTPGGRTIVFSLTGGTSTGNLSAVTDVGNGTYTATYTGILVGTAHTITATINGTAITNPTVPTVSVTFGAVNKLAYDVQPSATAVSDQILTVQPVVKILDINNNLVANSSLAVTLLAYANSTCVTAITVITGAPLAQSGNTATAVNGIATFTAMKITSVYPNAGPIVGTGNRWIRAQATGAGVVCSSQVAVSTGTPARTKFVTNPVAGVAAGVNFPTQAVIEVTDINYNRVTTATNEITVAPYTSTACTTAHPTSALNANANPVTAVNGLATFSGMNFTISGTSVMSLRTAATGLTSVCQATAVTVNPNTAVKVMVFNPTTSTEAGACSGVMSVRVTDTYGNTNTAVNDTIALSKTGSAVLYSDSTCTTPITSSVTTVAGVYNFYLKDNVAETITITANPNTAGWADATQSTIIYPVSQIAAGYYDSCKIVNGNLKCSGYDGNTILGDGLALPVYNWKNPTNMTSGVSKVVLGSINSAYIKNNELYIVGANNYGQAGLGTSHPTNDILSASKVTTLVGNVLDVSVSSANICAVVDGTLSGELWCWGLNTSYQVGDNAVTTRLSPVKVISSGTTQVASQNQGTGNCAIVDGAAKCWGANTTGIVGDNTYVIKKVPTQVTGLTSGVTQIAMGYNHACAIVNGGLKCWGTNTWGQLGNGTLTTSPVPVDVPGFGSDVEYVTTGASTTCAIKLGALYCWGYNGDSRIGFQVTPTSNVYESSPLLLVASGVTQVSLGTVHGCAVINDKSYCWGASHYGALALGTTNINNSAMTAPIPTSLSSGVTSVSPGWYHVCAVKDSNAYCWGGNSYGALGDGLSGNARVIPKQVAGISSVLKIASGQYHTCAMLGTPGSATAKCWGYNLAGQIGDSTVITKLAPVTVNGLPANVTDIAAGNNHTCAVINQSSVYCWGDSGFGQLGYGSNVDKTSAFLIPTSNFPSGAVISKIIAAQNFTCALVNDSVYCWGYNIYGQIGKGAINVPVSYLTPQLTIASGATDISGMYNNVCAVVSGSIQCWGNNPAKTIWNSATANFATPTASLFHTNINVTSLSVGLDHICAMVDGTNKCWGNNAYGYLGDGSLTATGASAVTPGTVTTPIVAGNTISCTIVSGALKCWGSNYGYQLGSEAYAPLIYGPTANP